MKGIVARNDFSNISLFQNNSQNLSIIKGWCEIYVMTLNDKTNAYVPVVE